MAVSSDQIDRAIRHLRRADPVMRALIQKAGPYTFKPRRDRFQALVSSIISQQISGSAARAIRQRLIDYLAPEKISPECLCRLDVERLRSLGLSPQKASYLLDLAGRVASNELKLK